MLSCMALKVSTFSIEKLGSSNAWSKWRLAQDAGLCNFGLPTTQKVMFTNLNSKLLLMSIE